MKENNQDHILLERIRAGDLTACDECVQQHAGAIYRLATRLVHDPAEAEDVVQETFLNAFKAIEKFDGRSELRTWLYRIAYNAAMLRFRRKQPEFVSIDDPDKAGEANFVPQNIFDWTSLAEEEVQRGELRVELEKAIQDLPEKLRTVFVLRELEGLSTDETASTLGVTLEVVKTRLHRARLWLRESLTGYFQKYVAQE